MHRVIYPDAYAPAPSPFDDEAWDGVLVVTGGLGDPSEYTPTEAEVLAHWQSQGVPRDDAWELLRNVRPDAIITVQTLFSLPGTEDARRYAFTERAVEDARRATGSRP